MHRATRAVLLALASLLVSDPGRTPLNAQTVIATSDTLSSVRWNRLVPVFAAQAAAIRTAARVAAARDSAALARIARTPPPILFRIFPIMSVAQYGALESARGHRGVSSAAAVAGASAAVLTELFPDSAVRASIAHELAVDLERAGRLPHSMEAALAGRRLGERVARSVLAWVPPFEMMAPFAGAIPQGPGMWSSAPNVPPIGTSMATSRTWLLDSASQFRPGPPPRFESPTFRAALDEVRRVARERTLEQTRIAQKWNGSDPMVAWNATASAAIVRHHMGESDAVRVLTLLNVAASDAVIACFDAKYHYWTIRPSQADTTIALADDVGLPNFPSYPSGHACTAGAFDAVLGHFFPRERTEFTHIAEEQAMSRLYGGIHYRFDNDEGLALGRAVAQFDIERERRRGFDAWNAAGVANRP